MKVLVDKRGQKFWYKIVVQIFHFHSHIFELKLWDKMLCLQIHS